MSDRSILRQVALVSYGTLFLRDENTLEDWCRHSAFSEACFQFRSLPDNALLADDFTLWLGILKLAGATRLSLHRASEFQQQPPRNWRGGDHVIVVHCAQHHELWAVGQEDATWRDHPLIPDEARYTFPVFLDSASRDADLESYWLIESRPGTMDVAATDWKKLAASIGTDLATAIPSSVAPFGPYIVPTDASGAPLPLFPFTKQNAKAHHIIASLVREESRFSNDMNPKNENTYHQRMDDEVHRWGERLCSWMTEALLRCANDAGAASGPGTAFKARVHTSAPVQAPPSPLTPTTSAPTMPSAAAAPLRPVSRWTNRFVLFFMIAVFTIFFVALANVIVAWPWLAILVGLPPALYASTRKPGG